MSSRSLHSHGPRSRSPSPRQYSAGLGTDRMDSLRHANKTALHIDFLTHNVRESHLHHIFGWYGHVERVHLTPSRGRGKERDGSAYVLMSSVEEAAKAALYMNGGQIDGASLTIKTCEPPTNLPNQRPDMRSRDRPPIGIVSRDRRAGRDEPYRAGSELHSYRERQAPSRAMHPDRRRMVSTGRQDPRRSSNDYDQPAPMRRWGHLDHSQHDSARGRNRSASPPSSAQRGSRRRSSEAMRASPSY
ncbi:RRM domain-containing protein [Pseudozyma hubeiensis]|nr:RRM domain-containing protein [Pseudozyma hubeiensis]